MKSLDLLATEENVYLAFEADAIGRNEDVAAFVSMLNSLDRESVIAVNARWGEGKTFFIKQVKMILDSFNQNYKKTERKEEIYKVWRQLTRGKEIEVQPFVTVYYDAWENDNDEDPVLSLIVSILQEIDGLEDLGVDRSLLSTAGELLDFFTGRTVKGVLEGLKGKNPLECIRKGKDFDAKVTSFLKAVLPERGNRLVIFVDELDRCKPDYAIRLLERVKHYFANENITFVFSVNIDELQHTICKFYGSSFDACRYLDRFFDFRVELPKPDMEKYNYSIGLGRGGWLYESVCKEVIEMFHMGLREIAKFYRIAKTVAYKPTHRESGGFDASFSDGKGRQVCFYCIVPLMIGLSMSDRLRYNNFIRGEDSGPLKELFKDSNEFSSLLSLLLNEGETYSEEGISQTRVCVRREDKLEEVYNAVFVKKYDRYSYETGIGKVSFTGNIKDEVLRIVSGLSKYADYQI